MTSVIATVSKLLEAPDGAVRERHPGELVFETDAPALPRLADRITHELGGRLMSLFASDDRARTGVFVLHHVWSLPRLHAFLRTSAPVDPAAPSFPSIAARHPAANWFEREVMDQFGLVPEGHPNPSRVVLHDDWPDGAWALRKDFPGEVSVPRAQGDFHPFRPVTGEGVFQVPVGPVHAGIIEPGHFRFSVAGEPIINLDMQLHYTHKGTEKLAEGRRPAHVVFLAERISGDSAFAHAVAYCACIERIACMEIPQRAIVIRTILLEMERLSNHIGDVGAILLDVGYAVGAATAFHLKEQLLRLNEILTGHRLLHGMARLGGVTRPIEDTVAKRDTIRSTLSDVRRTFDALIEWVLSTSSVLDRLETTGILTQKDALQLGAVGVAARASGVDRDLRRDHPHLAYPFLEHRAVVQKGGDVFARFKVRVDEVAMSIEIILQLLGQHSGEALAAPPAVLPASTCALGYVEGWRGEIVHWVMTDAAGNIGRWKITDPSFHNWRALSLAVRGNIVPDFPVINKSFNLSYSGNDR